MLRVMEMWELVLKMKEFVVKTKQNKTKLSPFGPHDNRPHEMSVLIANSSLDPCVNVSQKHLSLVCVFPHKSKIGDTGFSLTG